LTGMTRKTRIKIAIADIQTNNAATTLTPPAHTTYCAQHPFEAAERIL